MSIRFRILAACVSLTVLTAALGLFMLTGQRRLGQVVPGVELWVVGERLPSDHGTAIEALLNAPRVRRLGYRRDVESVLAAADIFVLPSQFEGLPMSVIEAMLTALPVVATSIRGPREQVVHEKTGLLVSPIPYPGGHSPLAHALNRLVNDPALRTRMGAAGRQRACERYDEARVVAQTLDVLGL